MQSSPNPDTTIASYARPSARQFFGRSLITAAVTAVVVFLLNFARGDMKLATMVSSLAYGECIALCSWLLIDGGRFLLAHDSETGWPIGWRGWLLPVAGTSVGFVLGQALGDLVMGHPIYSGYATQQRSLKADVLVTTALGAGISGYFYLRGRSAWHEARLVRTERDLTLARLHMLQAQLEPHMLFNTLANLRVLIGFDPPRAQAMLDRMIAYLRATLDGSRATEHPLSAEFERLADYLALMAVRMGPRLQVRFELPDALRAVPVPPMLLQPLVENCIKHGLEPKVSGGSVEVTARQEGTDLVLSVRDTGVGLPAPDAVPTTVGASFGVSQVRERLAALHGARADLALAAADDDRGGVLVTVRLPMPISGAKP